MEASENVADGRLRDLEAWRARVGPAIDRLIRDQEYRDWREANRDKRWRRVALWIAAGAGSLTIAGSGTRMALEALRYLGVL